ncbi:MAG: penicillin-binding protein activator [Devosia sp.]|jgi:branched-chain amino acid transport system substrate-binding protein|uniref:penicillin-binding protein activator n=1 Tax=Devosia sp. TaxID=1871048 RepID=UPI0019D8A57A|nr:penicillin-binding protein activator [Devosia sp.]MBF0677327.1 penicillin-binding protein activator [Devosia sp.]
MLTDCDHFEPLKVNLHHFRHTRRGVLALIASGLLTACAPGTLQWGSRTLGWPERGSGAGQGSGPTQSVQPQPEQRTMGSGRTEVFGRGPVPVAMLMPLSGDAALVQVGTSLANAAKLAIGFIEANPNIGENITITLHDSGSGAAGATSAATAAVQAGAKLILGPVSADQVSAAGTVARTAGIKLIGFANNPSVAGQGVFLLSVLPDMEMKRAIGHLKADGRRGLAGIFPATPYGEALATAFRQQAIAAGFSPSAVYMFSSPGEAAQIAAQAKPLIDRNAIDAIFLPERTSAPAFAAALLQAGAMPGDLLQLVGSADWAGDAAILAAPGLQGAIYPAVDEAGYNAIAGDYAARFGGRPHQLATLAYTAVILANVNRLSLATPPYDTTLLTAPGGFNGRDGQFRFLSNGRAEYALALRKVQAGGVVAVDGAKI